MSTDKDQPAIKRNDLINSKNISTTNWKAFKFPEKTADQVYIIKELTNKLEAKVVTRPVM